ncbi:hypothetical protein BGL_2c23230 [Burkholderia plantarii]|uniref:Uncharacterized protein n=1 Tax=Burkholderia plantarii TaxID=41899 RepID=A0A0B6RYH2_BURPL|nr:hypothetical protein BGL_2c23230 [Burkholderia plantarii]
MADRLAGAQMNCFVLDAAPDRLDKPVVVSGAFAVHDRRAPRPGTVSVNAPGERLAEARIERSVGNRGDSHDTALAETIDGRYKAEPIHRHIRKTRESVEPATLERVASIVID